MPFRIFALFLYIGVAACVSVAVKMIFDTFLATADLPISSTEAALLALVPLTWVVFVAIINPIRRFLSGGSPEKKRPPTRYYRTYRGYDDYD